MRLLFKLTLLASIFGLVARGAFTLQPFPSPSVRVEFRLTEDHPAKGLIEATVPGSNEKIYLHKKAIITNEDIVKANVIKMANLKKIIAGAKAAGVLGVPDIEEAYEVDITFTEKAGERMAKATGGRDSKRLAIMIDGRLISAANAPFRISTRASLVGSGFGFPKDEAERIARALNKK